MARARNIKPGFFKNEVLAELEPFDRLLFIGLWCLADREGRLEDRPKRIKMELFPCDNYDVESGIRALADSGFVRRYTAAGVAVIEVANFSKHQTPHGTEKDSALPDENGQFTVHERGKNGYSTGKTSLLTVKPQKPNRGETVDSLCDNTLIPDSLIPDSPIPESSSLRSEARVQPAPVASPSAPTALGTRLPENWTLPDEWRAWAMQEEPTWTVEHCTKVSEVFLDHWRGKAGKDGRKSDWQATWRNWVRRDGPMKGAKQQGQNGKFGADGRGLVAGLLTGNML